MHAQAFQEPFWRRASDSGKTEELKLNELPAGTNSQAMGEAVGSWDNRPHSPNYSSVPALSCMAELSSICK